jgi:predicted transcriptional regulator
MKELRVWRQLADLSQISLARCADVSRMRLQLAEAGELALRPEEVNAVNRVLHDAIKRRAATLRKALVASAPLGTGA